MILEKSEVAKQVRTSLLDAVEHVIPAQAYEIEKLKLELALLRSIGVSDEQWVEEPSAHITKKLPRELLGYLDQQFHGIGGDRQFFVGE